MFFIFLVIVSILFKWKRKYVGEGALLRRRSWHSIPNDSEHTVNLCSQWALNQASPEGCFTLGSCQGKEGMILWQKHCGPQSGLSKNSAGVGEEWGPGGTRERERIGDKRDGWTFLDLGRELSTQCACYLEGRSRSLEQRSWLQVVCLNAFSKRLNCQILFIRSRNFNMSEFLRMAEPSFSFPLK